jgi:hypothetical protein
LVYDGTAPNGVFVGALTVLAQTKVAVIGPGAYTITWTLAMKQCVDII